jgi:diguanylate cyclase (GGDEF)-like protein
VASDTRLRGGRRLELRRAALLVLVLLPSALLLLWLLGRTIDRNRTAALNSQLVADLQVARATLESDVAVASRRATSFARLSRVQQALARGDARAMQRLTRQHPDTLLVSARGVRRGTLSPLGIRRTVQVVAGGKTIGRVVADAPLDEDYVSRVESGLPTGSRDLVVVTRRRRVAVGTLQGGLTLWAPAPRTVKTGGRSYRALQSPLARDRPDLRVVALARGSSSFVSAWRLPLAVLATLFAIGVLVVLPFGVLSSEERRQRLPRVVVEEPEVIEHAPAAMNVTALGEKLAAANDVEALLRVILDSAIKATGAAGGAIARPGEPATQRATGSGVLRVPVETNDPAESFALLLYPPPSGFSAEAAGVARWLGEHASTAIRSARFHRVVQEDPGTDELTGLANRRRFTATLQQEFARTESAAAPLSVVLADLDDFKSFNDRHGIRAGDDVLKAFAATARRCARDVDVAARIGGEEFGIVLPETDTEGARQFSERLRTELRSAEGLPEPVTASFGIASYPEARTAEELLTTADARLRHAKRGGKDRIDSTDGAPTEAARA